MEKITSQNHAKKLRNLSSEILEKKHLSIVEKDCRERDCREIVERFCFFLLFPGAAAPAPATLLKPKLSATGKHSGPGGREGQPKEPHVPRGAPATLLKPKLSATGKHSGPGGREGQPKEPHVPRGDSGKDPPPVKQKPRSQ